MNEFKAIYIIETSILRVTHVQINRYNTVEALKAETINIVSEMAEFYGISGDFSLTMTIEKNGEYYDSDEATANYTNGVLTVDV